MQEIRPGQVWKYVDDPSHTHPFSILAPHPTEPEYWILSFTRQGQHVGISSESLRRFAALIADPYEDIFTSGWNSALSAAFNVFGEDCWRPEDVIEAMKKLIRKPVIRKPV